MNSSNPIFDHTSGVPRTESAPQINLQPEPGQADFWIDMESFFDFSFWLAEELQDLIDRHQMKF